MGTAQRQQSPNSMTWNDSGNWQNLINQMRSNFVQNTKIQASHINLLNQLCTDMQGHYHNYTDQYQTATFGNNGDRTTYTESKNTNSPTLSYSTGSNVSAFPIGGKATQAYHQNLVNLVNQLNSHLHNINDRTA